MPIVEGSVPAALPGGQAMASRPAQPPGRPLLLRTPARAEIAFAGGHKSEAPAFWKTTKKAFK